MPEPHKRVWRPVLGRLTAFQAHPLRTGSQSRAGAEPERSDGYTEAPERSDPLTVRPEVVRGAGPLRNGPSAARSPMEERSDDATSAASHKMVRRRRFRFNPLLAPIRKTDPDHPGGIASPDSS